MIAPVSQSSVAEAPAKSYGWSVFWTASARFWRATVVFLVVVLVNAGIQALLLLPKPIPGVGNVVFMFLALLSYLVFVMTLGMLAAAALATAQGKVSIGETFARIRPHFGRFFAWILLWTVLCTIGFMLHQIVGIILLLLTPYVPLAAADGARNPVAANFRAIRGRFGRYLLTLVVSCIFLVGLYLGSAITSFFLDGAIAALAFWIVGGLIGAWMITGWALLYRSTPVGSIAPHKLVISAAV